MWRRSCNRLMVVIGLQLYCMQHHCHGTATECAVWGSDTFKLMPYSKRNNEAINGCKIQSQFSEGPSFYRIKKN